MHREKRVLAVIPARLASQRLPEKALRDISGKTLVQRVWEQGKQSKRISELVLATDSEEIAALAKSFGARVEMTAAEIKSGSERVAVTCERLGVKDWDCVVNLQGDMPFISPELIDQTIDFHFAKNVFAMSTVATPITDEAAFLSNSVVKVALGIGSRALYFSRAPIPHSRNGDKLSFASSGKSTPVFGFKHFGLYVFRPDILGVFQDSEPVVLEDIEKLEQLRLLERGYPVGVHIVEPELTSNSVEVDTQADLEKACAIASGKN
jgi:3-deoxy-manno-octulosonate cytidylyltransferase (CMP-KDO synthetase)